MINVLQDDLFKPFVVYRSSAGSGKTYTLALEYLKLALSGSSYRNILAVTFTNKATKEMKSRILEFLYQLAQDKPNDGIRAVLLDSIRISDEQLTDKARYLLSSILHGYSFFSVMTIDTFFQKVVRSFAREMGLQAGFKLEMDTGKVLDEVIDQLLMDVGKTEKSDLTRWLVEFASEKVELGRSWDFRRDIKQLSTELFKEEFKLKEGDLLRAEGRQLRVADVLKQMRKHVSYFENNMQKIGQKAVSIMEAHGLTIMDFSYNHVGIMGYFVKLANKEISKPGTRVLKALETDEAWYTKKSPVDIILQAVESGLGAAAEEAVAFCNREYETYLSAQQSLRFIYTFGILADISQKLDQYKQENDFMLISDAPLFLKEIIGKDETPFIYEKIGTTFNHFLIDEFQDTSGFQWDNFRPLVENSLDAGYQNLVVGDIKQSIYRWRGGDWRLLLEQIQQDISPLQTQVKNLDKNYRSKRHIIDFNNSLFATLPKLFEQELRTKVAESDNEAVIEQLYARTNLISEAYIDAHQHLPDSKKNEADWLGYVRIELLSEEETSGQEYGDEESTDVKSLTLKRIPRLVEDLQDKGYRPEDIAFLVRRKEEGKAIANELMLYKGEGKAKAGYSYEIVSSESLFLESSLCVTFLIDLLTFLNNPGNNIARAGVLYKYQRIKSGDTLEREALNDLFNAAAGVHKEGGLRTFYAILPLEFVQQRSYLNQLPLFELVEQLIRIFKLGETQEISYLQAFQDAVLDFSNNEQGDIYSFLDWWYEQGHQRSVQVSEQLNAMRVLTIHKAKGLQFKVVVMPFCDWSLDHHPFANNILWLQAQQRPLSAFGPMPLKYGKTLKDTVYRQDYYEEMIRAFIDNLNLLYVAFTRAEECLYAFAQINISKQGLCKLTSVANALYLAFTQEVAQINSVYPHISLHEGWKSTDNFFELGTPPQKPFKEGQQEREEKYQSSLLTAYPSTPWRNKLTVRQKATSFFVKEENNNKEDAIRINYGILLRDVLLRLTTQEHLERTLNEIYYERGITDKEKKHLALQASQISQHPRIKTWFDGTFPQIKTGASILVGSGQEYHPDRVMISGNLAVIVNFRIGKHNKELRYAYRGQVKKYMKLIKEMGYQSVEGYLLYLEEVLLEKVV